MGLSEELFRKHLDVSEELTRKGIEQVYEACAKLKNMIGDPQYMQKETEAAVQEQLAKMREEQEALSEEES